MQVSILSSSSFEVAVKATGGVNHDRPGKCETALQDKNSHSQLDGPVGHMIWEGERREAPWGEPIL